MSHLRRIHVAAHLRKSWRIAGLYTLLVASACQAQSLPPESPQQGAMWLTVSDRTLARLRGGFDLGSGLVVSFGISRAVYINGQLITATSFQLGDINTLTAAQAAVLGQKIVLQPQLVQNGPGNTVDPVVMQVPLATYIQNTLNNQLIRNQTVIQATSNSMGIVKSLNLQATINEALANAIGSR
ncbi:hypothetical protein SAMN05216344_11228 [Polaromonas sp. OV174]|uniref:hypothetical protein n=1 Tax=Polaromonas sp. OV174 TaxID=1855300 RepID=UPI0008F2523E|nr:hypothetical protein [Polaromonas sp. OV174]SFC24255.1 hypothetical protein SAMN05216344_11228 [Polaromonas sp. OV174]